MRTARTADRAAWVQRVQRTGLAPRDLPVRLESAGAAGILTSTWSQGWGMNKVFNARTQRAPTLDIACEDYGLVVRLAQHNQHPVLEVAADAEFLGEQPVSNVIAEIRGEQLPNEYVLLSAHFDSWDGGSCATDNGTGTITMMEAMRLLKLVYPHPAGPFWSGTGAARSRGW